MANKLLLAASYSLGVTPVEMKEIVYQATAYLGIGRTLPFLHGGHLWRSYERIPKFRAGRIETYQINGWREIVSAITTPEKVWIITKEK